MAKKKQNRKQEEHHATWKSDLKLRLERQRKGDEVLDATMDSWEWVKSRLRWLLPTLVVVALVWLGVLAWRGQTAQSLSDSEGFLRDATLAMQGSGDLKERETAANAQLDELLKPYAGTRAARYGYVLKGDMAMEEAVGSDDANSLYSQALQDYTTALNSAKTKSEKQRIRLSIAKVHESKGEYDEAINLYKLNLDTDPKSPWKDTSQFLLASAYEQSGQTAKAIEEYKKINEDSAWYTDAKQRLQWLQAPVVSAAEDQSAL